MDYQPAVTIHVVRDIDGQIIDYVRECSEMELDGYIAREQELPGHLLEMRVSPPLD
jgi:hypothetical protein